MKSKERKRRSVSTSAYLKVGFFHKKKPHRKCARKCLQKLEININFIIPIACAMLIKLRTYKPGRYRLSQRAAGRCLRLVLSRMQDSSNHEQSLDKLDPCTVDSDDILSQVLDQKDEKIVADETLICCEFSTGHLDAQYPTRAMPVENHTNTIHCEKVGLASTETEKRNQEPTFDEDMKHVLTIVDTMVREVVIMKQVSDLLDKVLRIAIQGRPQSIFSGESISEIVENRVECIEKSGVGNSYEMAPERSCTSSDGLPIHFATIPTAKTRTEIDIVQFGTDHMTFNGTSDTDAIEDTLEDSLCDDLVHDTLDKSKSVDTSERIDAERRDRVSRIITQLVQYVCIITPLLMEMMDFICINYSMESKGSQQVEKLEAPATDPQDIPDYQDSVMAIMDEVLLVICYHSSCQHSVLELGPHVSTKEESHTTMKKEIHVVSLVMMDFVVNAAIERCVLKLSSQMLEDAFSLCTSGKNKAIMSLAREEMDDIVPEQSDSIKELMDDLVSRTIDTLETQPLQRGSEEFVANGSSIVYSTAKESFQMENVTMAIVWNELFNEIVIHIRRRDITSILMEKMIETISTNASISQPPFSCDPKKVCVIERVNREVASDTSIQPECVRNRIDGMDLDTLLMSCGVRRNHTLIDEICRKMLDQTIDSVCLTAESISIDVPAIEFYPFRSLDACNDDTDVTTGEVETQIVMEMLEAVRQENIGDRFVADEGNLMEVFTERASLMTYGTLKQDSIVPEASQLLSHLLELICDPLPSISVSKVLDDMMVSLCNSEGNKCDLMEIFLYQLSPFRSATREQHLDTSIMRPFYPSEPQAGENLHPGKCKIGITQLDCAPVAVNDMPPDASRNHRKCELPEDENDTSDMLLDSSILTVMQEMVSRLIMSLTVSEVLDSFLDVLWMRDGTVCDKSKCIKKIPIDTTLQHQRLVYNESIVQLMDDILKQVGKVVLMSGYSNITPSKTENLKLECDVTINYEMESDTLFLRQQKTEQENHQSPDSFLSLTEALDTSVYEQVSRSLNDLVNKVVEGCRQLPEILAAFEPELFLLRNLVDNEMARTAPGSSSVCSNEVFMLEYVNDNEIISRDPWRDDSVSSCKDALEVDWVHKQVTEVVFHLLDTVCSQHPVVYASGANESSSSSEDSSSYDAISTNVLHDVMEDLTQSLIFKANEEQISHEREEENVIENTANTRYGGNLQEAPFVVPFLNYGTRSDVEKTIVEVILELLSQIEKAFRGSKMTHQVAGMTKSTSPRDLCILAASAWSVIALITQNVQVDQNQTPYVTEDIPSTISFGTWGEFELFSLKRENSWNTITKRTRLYTAEVALLISEIVDAVEFQYVDYDLTHGIERICYDQVPIVDATNKTNSVENRNETHDINQYSMSIEACGFVRHLGNQRFDALVLTSVATIIQEMVSLVTCNDNWKAGNDACVWIETCIPLVSTNSISNTQLKEEVKEDRPNTLAHPAIAFLITEILKNVDIYWQVTKILAETLDEAESQHLPLTTAAKHNQLGSQGDFPIENCHAYNDRIVLQAECIMSLMEKILDDVVRDTTNAEREWLLKVDPNYSIRQFIMEVAGDSSTAKDCFSNESDDETEALFTVQSTVKDLCTSVHFYLTEDRNASNDKQMDTCASVLLEIVIACDLGLVNTRGISVEAALTSGNSDTQSSAATALLLSAIQHELIKYDDSRNVRTNSIEKCRVERTNSSIQSATWTEEAQMQDVTNVMMNLLEAVSVFEQSEIAPLLLQSKSTDFETSKLYKSYPGYPLESLQEPPCVDPEVDVLVLEATRNEAVRLYVDELISGLLNESVSTRQSWTIKASIRTHKNNKIEEIRQADGFSSVNMKSMITSIHMQSNKNTSKRKEKAMTTTLENEVCTEGEINPQTFRDLTKSEDTSSRFCSGDRSRIDEPKCWKCISSNVDQSCILVLDELLQITLSQAYAPDLPDERFHLDEAMTHIKSTMNVKSRCVDSIQKADSPCLENLEKCSLSNQSSSKYTTGKLDTKSDVKLTLNSVLDQVVDLVSRKQGKIDNGDPNLIKVHIVVLLHEMSEMVTSDEHLMSTDKRIQVKGKKHSMPVVSLPSDHDFSTPLESVSDSLITAVSMLKPELKQLDHPRTFPFPHQKDAQMEQCVEAVMENLIAAHIIPKAMMYHPNKRHNSIDQIQSSIPIALLCYPVEGDGTNANLEEATWDRILHAEENAGRSQFVNALSNTIECTPAYCSINQHPFVGTSEISGADGNLTDISKNRNSVEVDTVREMRNQYREDASKSRETHSSDISEPTQTTPMRYRSKHRNRSLIYSVMDDLLERTVSLCNFRHISSRKIELRISALRSKHTDIIQETVSKIAEALLDRIETTCSCNVTSMNTRDTCIDPSEDTNAQAGQHGGIVFLSKRHRVYGNGTFRYKNRLLENGDNHEDYLQKFMSTCNGSLNDLKDDVAEAFDAV